MGQLVTEIYNDVMRGNEELWKVRARMRSLNTMKDSYRDITYELRSQGRDIQEIEEKRDRIEKQLVMLRDKANRMVKEGLEDYFLNLVYRKLITDWEYS